MAEQKLIKILAKSQISSGIGSGSDFLVFYSLMTFGGVYYVWARAIGAFVGAIVNFNLNRHWTFKAGEKAVKSQAIKYAVTSTGSLLLNTFGTWLLTEYASWSPMISALIVSIVIALGYNFFMHKLFVFKT